jgi:hypothetical protein
MMCLHVYIEFLSNLYQRVKELQPLNKVVWVQIELEEEKVLLKQYVSLHSFVEREK